MRTLLFLSAALAAVSSAIQIFPVSLAQFDSELAQIEADAATQWKASAFGDKSIKIPENVSEVWELITTGHKLTYGPAIMNGVIDSLKKAGAGEPTEEDELVFNWQEMKVKVENLSQAENADELEKQYIRSILKTITRGIGWFQCEKFLNKEWLAKHPEQSGV